MYRDRGRIGCPRVDRHLTLTWEVSIRLDGFGVVPLAPIVFPADTTTTAKTAHARLVAR